MLCLRPRLDIRTKLEVTKTTAASNLRHIIFDSGLRREISKKSGFHLIVVSDYPIR